MPIARLTYALLLAVLGVAVSEPAMAHNPVSEDWQERFTALLSAVLLGIFWLMYGIGVRRTPPRFYQLAYFHLALVLCTLAVLGPLDEWAETSAAAHMSQHMVFMVVVAPLWVLSRPLPQLISGGGKIGVKLWKPILRLTQYPMLMAYLHGMVIWFWHVPYFYNLALENPWWHIVEHFCFIFTAGLFWWATLKGGFQRTPWALLAVLFTLMHTGFLGALLTFAHTPLYGEARDLADQQLAGLIMWVAGSIPYLLASAWIAHRWFRDLMRRMNAA